MTMRIFLSRRLFLRSLAVGFTWLGLPRIVLARKNSGKPNSTKHGNVICRRGTEDLKRLGIDAKELENLVRLFQEMLDDDLHLGAQLAVFKDGELVIELSGGTTGPSGEPVSPDTLFQVRSITKALAAMVMLALHDHGLFSFEDPVAKHWPAFAKNGKGGITVAHIMSHRAGIPDGPQIQAHFWNNRKAVAEAVEEMRPIWPPGSTSAYHALSYGWILDELAYRWAGQNIAGLFHAYPVASQRNL